MKKLSRLRCCKNSICRLSPFYNLLQIWVNSQATEEPNYGLIFLNVICAQFIIWYLIILASATAAICMLLCCCSVSVITIAMHTVYIYRHSRRVLLCISPYQIAVWLSCIRAYSCQKKRRIYCRIYSVIVFTYQGTIYSYYILYVLLCYD